MHKDDRTRKKNITSDIFLGFLGLLFFVLQLFILKYTEIESCLVIAGFVLIGLLAMLIDYNRYVFVYEFSGFIARLFCFLQNTLIWGSILGLSFFGINYFFAKDNRNKTKYIITDVKYNIGPLANRNSGLSRSVGRYSVSTERRPVFTAVHNGKSKYFEFKSSYYEDRNEFKYIIRVTSSGYFGFDIIKYDILK